jgi:hypothetical protein
MWSRSQKLIAQASPGIEPGQGLSASNMATTPLIIGLRTW